jgi:hypothetical protein
VEDESVRESDAVDDNIAHDAVQAERDGEDIQQPRHDLRPQGADHTVANELVVDWANAVLRRGEGQSSFFSSETTRS